LKKERADHWLKCGAQPSETVRKLMRLASTGT
jgi:ribosomal protein S16